MTTESEKPSTLLMLFKIAGSSLIMVGVVFLIASGDVSPGLPLGGGGIGLLVIAKRLAPKAAEDGAAP